jgi:hypothetical protein
MRRKVFVGMAIALLVLVGLSACSSTSTSSTQTQTVNVTLTDSGITATPTTFHPGQRCHFIVTSHGTVSHEFLIMPPGMAAMMGEVPMSQWYQQAWHATGMIGPDMTATFAYTFGTMPMMQSGQYAGFGSYADGHPLMQVPVTVQP